MRILRYGKTVPVEFLPGSTFALVPERTITSAETTDRMFDAIVDAVKKSGFPYTLVEQTETLIDSHRER